MPTDQYLLISEVARRTRLRPAMVKKVFPITRLGGRPRITPENFEATIRSETFRQTLTKAARPLPLQMSSSQAAQQLREQGLMP